MTGASLNTYPVLVRIDRNFPETLVLATYKTSDKQYITYKNTKPVGWSSYLYGAIGLHEMYLGIYKEVFWPCRMENIVQIQNSKLN